MKQKLYTSERRQKKNEQNGCKHFDVVRRIISCGMPVHSAHMHTCKHACMQYTVMHGYAVKFVTYTHIYIHMCMQLQLKMVTLCQSITIVELMDYKSTQLDGVVVITN